MDKVLEKEDCVR